MTPATEGTELASRLSSTRTLLEEFGQEHLLTFADELDANARAQLLDQLADIDIPAAAKLMQTARAMTFRPPPSELIAPAKCIARHPENAQAFYEQGEELLAQGKVAAFTVAGGQGTRLGWNGPKGTFPATPITGKPLFRVFAEAIHATTERYGAVVPWYIMTSPINDADTRAFFRDNNYFGLRPTDIVLFPQGVLPSFDPAGKFMLSAAGRVAVNPDGHGGSLRALRTSGTIEDMRGRGIEQISYFQVDNPSVHTLDPLFLGLHVGHESSSGEMSSKMVPKIDAAEKVGVFCEVEGRTCVIEYSDLPDELAGQTDDAGELVFRAGSIAIHLLSVDFVDRLTSDSTGSPLPLHQARKAVSFVDLESGKLIEPKTPNATKLEMFVFDAVPKAERSLVWETNRVEEFAPIKNATGVDSAVSSHALQVERAARWLESAGVTVPRDKNGASEAELEICSSTALSAAQLAAVELPKSIDPGEQLVL